MKNKKGMILPEETLKLIIGTIVLVSLLVILIAVYYTVTFNKDLKLAEKSLENLLIYLDSGQMNTIKIFNPTRWHILSWSLFEKEQSTFPDSCPYYGKSCVCFCSNKDCSKEKVCSSSNLQIEISSFESEQISSQKEIYIDKPPITILIRKIQSEDGDKIQLTKIEGGGMA